MATTEKNPTAPNLPGVPAATGNSVPVPPTGPAKPVEKAAAPAPLPSGDVDKTKETVAAAGGNRGGRPRKDGLTPGTSEALEADRKKDRERKANKNKPAPLPAGTTAEPNPTLALAVENPDPSLAVQPVATFDGWSSADAAPVVVALLDAAEAYDDYDNRKIIAPLELDAAAQSRILSRSRWPEKPKLTCARALPAPTAKAFNLLGLPKAVKDYIEGIPALALLVQTILENKKNLKQIVREEMERKAAVTKPEETK